MLSNNTQQNVLVTGASGLIGSHVAGLLLANNYKVYLQYFATQPVNNHKRASYLKVSLTHPFSISSLNDVDIVVHCAASLPTSFDDSDILEVSKRNTEMDANIISFCKDRSAKLIYFSSISVYGSALMPWSETIEALPNNAYSEAKLATEDKIITELKDYLIYRVSSPFGPRQRTKNVLLKFLESKIKGENIYLYSGGSRRQDFIFVKDIAAAVLKGIKAKDIIGIFNIACGQTISMLALANTVLNIPPKTKSELVQLAEADVNKDYDPVISINKAKELLKWRPKTSLEKGLKLMLSQYGNI